MHLVARQPLFKRVRGAGHCSSLCHGNIDKTHYNVHAFKGYVWGDWRWWSRCWLNHMAHINITAALQHGGRGVPSPTWKYEQPKSLRISIQSLSRTFKHIFRHLITHTCHLFDLCKAVVKACPTSDRFTWKMVILMLKKILENAWDLVSNRL